MEQFDKFTAIFDPPKPETVKAEAKEHIGKRMNFEAYWMQDDDDPFPGEFACWSHELDFWVPESDLRDIA